ncbi:MAG: hypothetical protein JO041_03835, partial [Acidobacteria bacterium]|nr:hypothetical protein [Acidobacteriota bacterium]
LTFAQVTQAGQTSLMTSSGGPAPPQGFDLGSPATYYNLSTTAVFTGSLQLCVNYTGVSFNDPTQLRLLHYESGNWVDVTTSLNTGTMTICGSVTSLSPFVVAQRITSLTMGPQAMEGDLRLAPGAALIAGYDFTMPGQHPAATVSFVGPEVVFGWTCVSGPGSGSLIVPMVRQAYQDIQGGNSWLPSSDQHSATVYQGSTTVPNVCGGGQVRFQNGGTFVTGVCSTDRNDAVHLRWHYSGNGSAGGWSGTKSVVPTVCGH